MCVPQKVTGFTHKGQELRLMCSPRLRDGRLINAYQMNNLPFPVHLMTPFLPSPCHLPPPVLPDALGTQTKVGRQTTSYWKGKESGRWSPECWEWLQSE